MYGSSRFKWLNGGFYHLGHLKFPATLALSDADPDLGTVKRGNVMTFADNSMTDMAYAGIGSSFIGFLIHQVNLSGTTDAAGFKSVMIGQQDIPLSRGSFITLRVPYPGAIIESEGVGAAGYDQLVITSGTGALSTGSTLYNELSLEKGGWREAQAGDYVHGHLLQANQTPENAGEVRIRVEVCSPYIKSL